MKDNGIPISNKICGPFAIGGVGGSGSRVFAMIAQQLGIFIGDNLNASRDIMSFAPITNLYLQEPCLSIEEKNHREQPLIAAFDQSMQTGLQQTGAHYWGWKAPTTFLHLPEFSYYYGDKIHYVHIMRNGLDMAFSRNQNQVHNFGFKFGIDTDNMDLPVASLRYWIAANQYAIAEAKKFVPGRFLLLRFDDLCTNPLSIIQTFADFCGLSANSKSFEQAAKLVTPPTTLGRHRQENIQRFSKTEIEAVRKLGFQL